MTTEESQLREMLDAGMKFPNIALKLNRTACRFTAKLGGFYENGWLLDLHLLLSLFSACRSVRLKLGQTG